MICSGKKTALLCVLLTFASFTLTSVRAAEELLIPSIDESPATTADLRPFFAKIPPGFQPEQHKEDLLKVCMELHGPIVKARGLISRLEKQQLDVVQKAEFNEMKADLAGRIRPIIAALIIQIGKTTPHNFRGMSKEKITEAKKKVFLGINESAYYLSTYPESKQADSCRAVYAYLLFLNNRIYLAAMSKAWEKEHGGKPSASLRRNWKTQYFDKIFSLLEKVLPKKDIPKWLRKIFSLFEKKMLPKKDLPKWLRKTAMRVHGEALALMQKNSEAVAAYQAYLKTWPDAENVQSCAIQLNIADNCLKTGDTAKIKETKAMLAACIKENQESENIPSLVNMYYRTLLATGRIEDARKLWETYRPVFKKRMNDPERSRMEKHLYKGYYEWSLFFIGHMQLALMQHEKAKATFKQHIDFVKKLQKKGATLNTATPIYMQRSEQLLNFLQLKAVNPAPSLDAIKWGFKKEFSLQDNIGKVVAIVFRGYNTERSRHVLKFLQELYAEYGYDKGPLAVCSISFRKGKNPIKNQLAVVEQEAVDLELSYPVGIDPDPEFKIFRTYDVNVGSSSLVLINPAGELVYYEQDPRWTQTFGLIRNVIKRLLK